MGLGHASSVIELTEIKYPFTKIYPSNKYTICSDNNNENIWCTGYNSTGECGIGESIYSTNIYVKLEYFKKNNIKIKKISLSSVAYSTFFITKDNNKLYACGQNDNYQLGLTNVNAITDNQAPEEWQKGDQFDPVKIPSLNNVIDVQSSSMGFTVALWL